jgi:hypothetical protein
MDLEVGNKVNIYIYITSDNAVFSDLDIAKNSMKVTFPLVFNIQVSSRQTNIHNK